MPRATHPVDAVVRYFETAPVEAADLTLHILKGIVRKRQQADQGRPAVVKARAPRARLASASNPPVNPTEAQAAAPKRRRRRRAGQGPQPTPAGQPATFGDGEVGDGAAVDQEYVDVGR